jgi:hypothetical protein
MPDTTQNPQPIIDLILADINAVIPNFSSLVSSYRLLVGAAEEIHRTPNVCPDVFERAVRRYDNTGTLIDILLELLCCKIVFSSEFLSVSCAPVDLFRLLANPTTGTDTPHNTAEQVVGLEVLRRVLDRCESGAGPCLPYQQVVCPSPPAPTPAATPAARPAAAAPAPNPAATDTEECENEAGVETESFIEAEPEVEEELESAECFEKQVRHSHVKDFYSEDHRSSKTKPSKRHPKKS